MSRQVLPTICGSGGVAFFTSMKFDDVLLVGSPPPR